MALSTSISSAGHILLQSQLATRNLRDLSFEMSLRYLGQPILFHGGGGGCKLSLSTRKKRHPICSCCIVAGSQLASTAFTLGTVAVLPFYTLMVVAPKAEITKKSMDSNIPFVVLGLVYAYLLYLSWTPDTIRLMFASEYWLPELPGIVKMFSSEMTMASAWIHLLVVDLFAARCIYQDGLKNEVETRHSVSLCLLVCPVGILTHTLTKALARARVGSKHNK